MGKYFQFLYYWHFYHKMMQTVDYSVTDLSLGYTLSDNSSVTMNYASSDRSGEDNTKTWISLNIGF